jgi:hypothetical protein
MSRMQSRTDRIALAELCPGRRWHRPGSVVPEVRVHPSDARPPDVRRPGVFDLFATRVGPSSLWWCWVRPRAGARDPQLHGLPVLFSADVADARDAPFRP